MYTSTRVFGAFFDRDFDDFAAFFAKDFALNIWDDKAPSTLFLGFIFANTRLIIKLCCRELLNSATCIFSVSSLFSVCFSVRVHPPSTRVSPCPIALTCVTAPKSARLSAFITTTLGTLVRFEVYAERVFPSLAIDRPAVPLSLDPFRFYKE